MTQDAPTCEGPGSPDTHETLLVPGRTCWRTARANRVALIVDAADYFRTLKAAMLKARHSVLLIGWDFDTRIELEPRSKQDGIPDTLGSFISWLAEEKPDLRIAILKWDLGIVKTLGRGTTMLRLARWAWHERIQFKLDGAHPAGAAHHHKIVVIDDALAFCGGIDMTADRWDTRDHLDDNPYRRRPFTGRHYGPWHDATTAVDGEAARALGEHARLRWKLASGEELPAPPEGSDPWPEELRAAFTDVDVGIARTAPAYDGRGEIREIEALYLEAIRSARRSVYLESQYFASRVIAEAIAVRLREPDGPEFVLVNPETADGWLEEAAMGSARARLLDAVARADRHGRFAIYTPVTESGQPIYVHAKIAIVDDRFLRVGSSNLNNRSMGYDNECDLAIESKPGEVDVTQTIAAFRTELMAEHLGVDTSAVVDIYARTGSLIATVNALRGEGRSLRPFTPPDFGDLETALADNELLDPERAKSGWPARTGRKLIRRSGPLRGAARRA